MEIDPTNNDSIKTETIEFSLFRNIGTGKKDIAFLIKYVIGLALLVMGLLFFVFTTVSFFTDFYKYVLNGNTKWYIHFLLFIDKFLITFVVVFVAEGVIIGTKKTLRATKEGFSSFNLGGIDIPLVNMVILTISICFLKIVLEDKSGLEILYKGLGIGFLIIALGVWTYCERTRKGYESSSRKPLAKDKTD